MLLVMPTILHTDSTQLQKYLNLDQRGQVIAEYVWIDAVGGTRSKCKVSRFPILTIPHTTTLPGTRNISKCRALYLCTVPW
jgi:hypothetical protein